MRKILQLEWMLAVVLALAMGGGCSVMDASVAPSLSSNATWAVLPFINLTETPQAGQRVEAISASMLLAMGAPSSKQFSLTQNLDPLELDSPALIRETALSWAKTQKAQYALTGAVDEWRYKVGVDGEPAVGMTLQVLDVNTGDVVWSGVGAQTGWGREAVSAVAQKLVRQLLEQAQLPI